jgi:integrase
VTASGAIGAEEDGRVLNPPAADWSNLVLRSDGGHGRRAAGGASSTRFGELAGLRRGQVDLDGCAVRIVVATAETDDGRLIDDDPKSQAGRRRVAFPKEIAPELRWHLERFAQPGDDGLVFIGPKGGRLRRSTFRRTWTKARTAVGLPDLHFHDLRHTGNTIAAAQGASLRELTPLRDHSETGDHALDLGRNGESGRRERAKGIEPS